jgi:hypothetical protein
MKTQLKHAFLIAVAASCAPIFAQQVPSAKSIDFEVETRITTNRSTRGVSESALRPSASITVNAIHESGFAALVELATVSKTVFTDGQSILLFGGGYRGGDSEGVRYGVGAYYEMFPGAKYEAPMDLNDLASGTTQKRKFNTGYALFELGYGIFDIRYEHSLSKYFRGVSSGSVCPFLQDPTAQLDCYTRGDVSSRGTGYLSVIAKYKLNSNWQIGGHIGTQRVSNFSVLNLTDVRFSIDYLTGNWILGADLTSANVRDKALYRFQRSNGSTYQANQTQIALRAAYKF